MIQVTDQRYLDQINEPFRGSFSAEVKLFFKGGTRTFTDDDIFTISENETANIVADENPTQSTEITLSNYNHEFDINGTSGYFRDISDGIECQYRFGFHVIDEDGSDDIVWLDWKRRWCSGEASLAERQVTFTVADVFSTNDDDIEGYMSSNYGLVVTNVFNKSTYPQQENGVIGVDFDVDLTNTVMYYQPTYTSFNEIIQSVAFASGKQFYIDHKGVVHIDDDRTTPTGVHLGIGDYFEDNEAGKEKKVKKITVSYYVPEDSTVDPRPDFVRAMNGTGESVTVSNDFICSLEDGNRVMSYLVNYYEKRGTFECTFRGDPRLEPLDVITIDILNSDETVQTVTGTIISVENTYDGTFESTIECRYVTTDTTDDTASITGAENFVYPLDSNTPTPASVTLTCTTSINNPTKYVWEYYNMVTSAWTQIGTSSTLTIPYNTEWLSDDVTTTFRCTVNDSVSASVGIKRIYTHATYTYLGIQQTAPSNPTTGDYYLAPSGLVYLWNGQAWVTTTRSDLLINAVADGKTLTGIESTPLGQLIASMQGADGQPGADGKPGADGQPGTDGVSITGVTSYYLATSQSSGVTTETAGWTDTIQTMTETNRYLWTYQVTSFSDGHTETSTPYITGVYGDKGEQGDQGEPGVSGKTLILQADSYSFITNASGEVLPNQTITLTVQAENITGDIVWTNNKDIVIDNNTLQYTISSSVKGRGNDTVLAHDPEELSYYDICPEYVFEFNNETFYCNDGELYRFNTDETTEEIGWVGGNATTAVATLVNNDNLYIVSEDSSKYYYNTYNSQTGLGEYKEITGHTIERLCLSGTSRIVIKEEDTNNWYVTSDCVTFTEFLPSQVTGNTMNVYYVGGKYYLITCDINTDTRFYMYSSDDFVNWSLFHTVTYDIVADNVKANGCYYWEYYNYLYTVVSAAQSGHGNEFTVTRFNLNDNTHTETVESNMASDILMKWGAYNYDVLFINEYAYFTGTLSGGLQYIDSPTATKSTGTIATGRSSMSLLDDYIFYGTFAYRFNGFKIDTLSVVDKPNPILDGTPLEFSVTGDGLSSAVKIGYVKNGADGEQGQPGADGAPAKSLILTADSYSFHTDAEGNVKPNQTITITVQKQNILDDIVWSDNKNINVPTNTLTYQFNSSVGEEVTPINELKGLPYVVTGDEGYEEYIFGSEENITADSAYSGEEVVSNGSAGDADISIPDGTYSVWSTMGYFCVKTSATPPKFYYRYKTNVTDYYHVLCTNLNGSEFVAITPDSNGYVSYVGNLDCIQGEYLAMYAPYAIFASAGTTTGISAVNTQPVLVDIAKNQDIFTAKGLTTDEEIREYLDSIPYEDFASRDSIESITYPDNLVPNQLTAESEPTEGGYLANPDGTIVIQSDGSSETVVVTDGKINIGNVTGIDDGTYTVYVCITMAIVVPQIINHKVYIRFEGDGDNILAAYRLNSNFIFTGYRKTGNIFSLVENLDTSFVSGEESYGMVYLTYSSFNTDTSTRTTRAEKPVIIDITANESFFMERGLLTDDAIREYLDSIPYEKFGTTETIDTPTSQINPALDGTPTIFTVTAGDLSDSVQIGYVQDGEQGEAGSGGEMVTLVPSTTTYQVSSRDVVQTETVITIEARIKGADITGTRVVYPENFAKDATPDEGQAYDPDFAYMGTDLEHAQIDGHVTESYEGTINWHDSTQGYYVNVPLSDLQDYTEGLALAGLGYYINKKDIVDTVMSHKMYWRWNTDIITDGDIKLVSTLTCHRDNTGTFPGGVLVFDYDKTNQCVSAISDFNLTSDSLWWYISLIAGKDATARGDVVGKQFSYPVIVDITANQQLFTDKGLTTDAEIKAYLNGVAYEDFGKDILIDSNLSWEVTPSEADGYTTGKNTTMITVTIPVGSNLTGFAVKCTVADVGEDTVYINSVAVGEPTIRFFEQRTSPPTTSDNNGERFITGDYYVTSDGVPMMYDETSNSWRQPSNGDKYYDQIMTNVGNWWLSKGNNITTTTAALYGYFRTLYSNSAIIDQLSVAGIRLQEGGIIQSTVTLPDGTVRGYEPGDGETYGTTGFYLSADGTAEFYNMSAFGIFAKGSFQADAMVTGEGTSAITQSNLYPKDQPDWVSQKSYQQTTNTSSYSIGDVYSMNISPEDTYAFWTSVSFSTSYKNVYAYAMGIGDATVSATRLTGIENAIEGLDPTNYTSISRFVGMRHNGNGYQAVVVGGVSGNYTQRITVIDTTSATATATTHEYTNTNNPVQFASIPVFTDTNLIIYSVGAGINMRSIGYENYSIAVADIQSDGGSYSFSWGASSAQSGDALWDNNTEISLEAIQTWKTAGGVYDSVNNRIWIWFVGDGKMFPTEFKSDNWRAGARYRGNDYLGSGDFNNTKISTYNDYVATDNGLTVITYGDNTAWEIVEIEDDAWVMRGIDFGSTRYGFMGWDGTYIYGKNLSTNVMYRGTAQEWDNGTQTNLGYTISSNIVGKYLVDGDILSWSSNVKRTTHGQRMDNIISFFSQLLPKINPSTMSHMPESEPLASVTACSGTVRIAGSNKTITRMGCSSSTLTIDTNSGSYVYKSGVLYDDTETVEITELTILAKAASVNTKDILPQSSNTYDIGASNNYYRAVYCDTLFADEIGSGSDKVSRIYATYIGESSDKVSTIYTTNLYLGTYNKSSTGYTPLPNGLLLQWGYMDGNTNSKTWDITFPRTFSTLYCLTGGLVAGYADRTYEHMNFHNDFSRTGFGFNTYDNYQCFWMALGTM